MGKRCIEIDLGDIAKDDVTGFEGVVVAITKWLHGCDRIALQPKVDKDGKVPDNVTFDRLQLSLIKKHVVEATARELLESTAKKERTGGPTPSSVSRPATRY